MKSQGLSDGLSSVSHAASSALQRLQMPLQHQPFPILPACCAADAANLIAAGLDVGVFRCVIGDWLKSTAFEDDSPALQQLQAQMLHQLLMLFLDCQPVR